MCHYDQTMATKKTTSQNAKKAATPGKRNSTAGSAKKKTQTSTSSSTGTPKKKPGRPPKKVEFKEDAKDGDNDGLVQDGTIHERPATSTNSTPDRVVISTSLDTSNTAVAPTKKSIWARFKGIFK